jgi:phosphopantothenoylcysteine synthetase/decarboxylase
VHLPTPAGVERTDVRSARDMRAAVLRQIHKVTFSYRPPRSATTGLAKSRRKLKRGPT